MKVRIGYALGAVPILYPQARRELAGLGPVVDDLDRFGFRSDRSSTKFQSAHAERLEFVEFAGRKTPRCPASQEGDLFSSRVELRHTPTIGRECEECITKLSAVGRGSKPIECLTEIVENVLGRLDPDAEPDQIGWHLEFGPGSGRVGHHAGMLNQGLDRTERFGE